MTPADIRRRADTYRYRDEVHAKTSRILDALAGVMETTKNLTDFGTDDRDTPHRAAHTAAVEALARVEALKP